MPWPTLAFSWGRWPRKSVRILSTPCRTSLILPGDSRSFICYDQKINGLSRASKNLQREIRMRTALREMMEPSISRRIDVFTLIVHLFSMARSCSREIAPKQANHACKLLTSRAWFIRALLCPKHLGFDWSQMETPSIPPKPSAHCRRKIARELLPVNSYHCITAFGLPWQLKPEAVHFHSVHIENPRMGNVADAVQNHTCNVSNDRHHQEYDKYASTCELGLQWLMTLAARLSFTLSALHICDQFPEK